jgi:hypothetical protein
LLISGSKKGGEKKMTTMLQGKFGYPLGTLPTRSKEQWAEALILNAKRINEKRILSIPDETNFSEKIADPASVRWNSTITGITPDPRTGKSESMIRHSQRSNLLRSFTKYSTKLDEAFKTVGTVIAKKFADAVNVAKDLFAEGSSARTMRAVGTRLEGVGAAVIVPLFLTAHPDAMSKVRQGVDEISVGGPFDIVLPGYENMFMRMMTAELTFAMIQADKSGLDTTVLTALNARLNYLAQSNVNPALGVTPFATGGSSHLDIINDPVHGLMVDVSVDQI